MGIQLIKAGKGELPQIATLAVKIWQAHYPPIVGQAQVDYMLARFYSRDALIKQNAEGQDFYFIENDGETIGFISVSNMGNDHFFIHKFYIDANRQGKGLGEKVFEQAKTLFKSHHPITINLTVNRKNHRAINFYFKIGFKIKEVADFDIENGYVMNDFVMEWKGLP